MNGIQEKIQNAANDQLLRAALPTLQKFIGPLLDDMRKNARSLLLGDVPPTLAVRLMEGFNGVPLTTADVRVIWEAVGLAISDGATVGSDA